MPMMRNAATEVRILCAISCQQDLWLWQLASAQHPQQQDRRASCTSLLQFPRRQLLGTRQGAKAYWDHCSVLQSPRQQSQQHKARTQQQGPPKASTGSVRQTAFFVLGKQVLSSFSRVCQCRCAWCIKRPRKCASNCLSSCGCTNITLKELRHPQAAAYWPSRSALAARR